eukprot:TRINITY_DN64897_c0_g1_i1.p1 TRINITY_DN64897_c0_g1~~TRINITY_DN64897_c0_g1_i1.p1  ORF type:complete len:315 (+),score=35.88 TRINITY_DN64897_c0_g1_i1:55-999(+)
MSCFCSEICSKIFFNLCLLLFLTPAWLLSVIGLSLKRCGLCCSTGCLRNGVIKLSCLAFRATFACLCCFIRRDLNGWNEYHRAMKSRRSREGDRPIVVVANHTSFLDVMLALELTPLSEVGRSKMFVSGHLLKMPFLGSIVEAMDHLAVPFIKGAQGFELDKELMAERMEILREHVADGGVAAWFPEGKLNDVDPHEVQQFRAGGFSIPSDVDCEIWCIAFVGNSLCWPRTAMVGGSPAKLGIEFFRLCESSSELLAKAGHKVEEDRSRSLHLANLAQNAIQEAVTDLVHRGYSGVPEVDEESSLLDEIADESE